MPELPEVETVLRTLEHRIAGQEITEVRVIWGKTVIGDPDEFCRRLKGRHFLRFMRRGKYLLFGMEDCILMSHLRMEGKYFIQKPEEKLIPHTHIVFGLSGGDELRYNDTRKFGRMEILPADTDLNTFHDLGPEPFDEAFSAEYIHAWRRGRTMPVKSMLLNQNFCAVTIVFDHPFYRFQMPNGTGKAVDDLFRFFRIMGVRVRVVMFSPFMRVSVCMIYTVSVIMNISVLLHIISPQSIFEIDYSQE